MNRLLGFVDKFFDRRIYVFGLLFGLLFLFDFIAIQYSLYFHLRWVDVPVHFLGGFFLAALFFYLIFSNPRTKKLVGLPRTSKYIFFVTVVCVLGAAIVWEVVEFIAGRTAISPAFIPDTTLDLIAGTTGGYVFYLFYKQIRAMIYSEIEK